MKLTIRTVPVMLLLSVCLLMLASCNQAPSTVAATYAGHATAQPTLGDYRCWAGGFTHLPAGTLTLAANGRYESYRPHGGGSYSFSLTTSTINFLNGDYNYWEYQGVFQPATYSSEHRDRLVLMPIDATDPIGHERPGQYQYCYLEDNSSASVISPSAPAV